MVALFVELFVELFEEPFVELLVALFVEPLVALFVEPFVTLFTLLVLLVLLDIGALSSPQPEITNPTKPIHHNFCIVRPLEHVYYY